MENGPKARASVRENFRGITRTDGRTSRTTRCARGARGIALGTARSDHIRQRGSLQSRVEDKRAAEWRGIACNRGEAPLQVDQERERERERDKLVEAGERDGQSRAPLPRRECLAHSRKRQSGRDTV